MKQQQKTSPPKTPEVLAEILVPDGRWFQLCKESFSEAKLVEIVVRDGVVLELSQTADLSRIQLGKLVRRIGETFGDGI